jgi:hypothetical protein
MRDIILLISYIRTVGKVAINVGDLSAILLNHSQIVDMRLITLHKYPLSDITDKFKFIYVAVKQWSWRICLRTC